MIIAPSSTQLDKLSPTERRVCQLVADGKLHKQVARELGISIRTVHTHVARASNKLPGDGPPTRKIIRFLTLIQASDSAA